jgi:hypothetical protein
MDRCFFSRNPATHTSFQLLKVLKLGCPILLAKLLQGECSLFQAHWSCAFGTPQV